MEERACRIGREKCRREELMPGRVRWRTNKGTEEREREG